MGCEVTSSKLGNPNDALRLLKSNKYDLVVTRNRMGHGELGSESTQRGLNTGIGLAEKLRREGNNTPIIIYEYLAGETQKKIPERIKKLRGVMIIDQGNGISSDHAELMLEFLGQCQSQSPPS